jgi:hypothetical protein
VLCWLWPRSPGLLMFHRRDPISRERHPAGPSCFERSMGSFRLAGYDRHQPGSPLVPVDRG